MAEDPNPPGNEPEPEPTNEPEPEPSPEPAEDPTDWKAEARKWEKRAKDNSDAAARLKELEDKDKTEAQRLADAKAESDKAAEDARVEAARLRAAIKYGLDEEDLDLLGSGTEDEIEARAKRLSERIAPPAEEEEETPGVPRRPKPRLKPGATPSGGEPEETDPRKLAARIPRRGY